MKQLYIILGVLVALVAGIVIFYNGIVTKHQSTEAAWSNVESTLQRRYDLIPNLVSTVKGYASHEKETFTEVTEARAKALQTSINVDLSDPKSMETLVSMQGELAGALSKLIAVAESYPDLKASQNFLELQSQLEGTENRINVARVRYNEVARVFNTSIMTFPGNMVNNILAGFPQFSYFKADSAATSGAPKVEF